MITIKTVNSRIVYSNGENASGSLYVMPSQPFTFLDSADQLRKRVGLELIQYDFSDGQFAADALPKLAPTRNAFQDKTGLYYIVKYITASTTWTEYWAIDAAGDSEIEISDTIKVVPEPQVDKNAFVSSDDVSVLPLANMIPRADSNGNLDFGWLSSVPLTMLVYGYIGKASDFVIPMGVFGLVSDTDDGQGKFWDGAKFNVISAGTQNTGLNSATPVQILGYVGNPLPTPPPGVLAIGKDVGEGMMKFWDGENWNVIGNGLYAPNYLVGDSLILPVVGVICDPLPALPQQVIGLGFDVGETQRRTWDGYKWITFA